MVDAITLERRGKPTVVTTTTNFRPVAETLSRLRVPTRAQLAQLNTRLDELSKRAENLTK